MYVELDFILQSASVIRLSVNGKVRSTKVSTATRHTAAFSSKLNFLSDRGSFRAQSYDTVQTTLQSNMQTATVLILSQFIPVRNL
jgi:hypothetical protein